MKYVWVGLIEAVEGGQRGGWALVLESAQYS